MEVLVGGQPLLERRCDSLRVAPVEQANVSRLLDVEPLARRGRVGRQRAVGPAELARTTQLEPLAHTRQHGTHAVCKIYSPYEFRQFVVGTVHALHIDPLHVGDPLQRFGDAVELLHVQASGQVESYVDGVL